MPHKFDLEARLKSEMGLMRAMIDEITAAYVGSENIFQFAQLLPTQVTQVAVMQIVEQTKRYPGFRVIRRFLAWTSWAL